MRAIFRPLPRRVTRLFSILILVLWVAVMTVLVRRSYFQVSAATLATDLARYGSAAVWRGVYYRGEKIGFTVSQTVPEADGFELEEDGRLRMALLGATTAATIRTTAHVDARFALHAFEFSLDPGTGAIEVRGRINGRSLALEVRTPSGTRTEQRELAEPPALSLNLSRRLASGGLTTGARHQWTIFDPATLRNAPVTVTVGRRELIRGAGTAPLPAFRVEMEFAGLRTTSWVTDTGEVVREESPLGLITVRESPENARAMAISRRMQVDLLQASAIVPRMSARIDDPRDVRRMQLRLSGLTAANLEVADLQGVSQKITGDLVELVDPRQLHPLPLDPAAAQYLAAEPFIESDAPEIRGEAETAIRGVDGDRARAERLTRYVNALLDKKPTVSLPSAREVLRTKVGDCNEHTVLYVAMARAIGIPARIAAGLVFIHGAFYYHAWPEVYVDRTDTTGLWLPVDPTLNQFPADATHLRLTRGGLEKQAAILPLIGHLSIDVEHLELAPNSTPILVGRQPIDLGSIAIPIPQRQSSCCACR
ncbi:MAG TPA: transglutaminase-like domain-containing protein [Vicinamibacterales bacterium]|nr:transglutaminase-like domain-containing protein [Vicinamibacterales bacterium]